MTVVWDGYEAYYPDVFQQLNEMPRAAARQAYKRIMQEKLSRIDMLRQLLQANGIGLDISDDAIQVLNDWFCGNIEPDPSLPGRLLPIWYSVASDIGLFLGDVMIHRHPVLHWQFFTWGRKNISFQRHVIMGFRTEDPKFHTNIDIGRRVVTYGHQIIEKQGFVPKYNTITIRGAQIDVDAVTAQHLSHGIETNVFCQWLENAARRA